MIDAFVVICLRRKGYDVSCYLSWDAGSAPTVFRTWDEAVEQALKEVGRTIPPDWVYYSGYGHCHGWEKPSKEGDFFPRKAHWTLVNHEDAAICIEHIQFPEVNPAN